MPASTVTSDGHAGAPFGAMLRGGLAPAAVCGLVSVVVFWVLRGSSSGLSALLGLAVALGFFVSGFAMLSQLVRSANPMAFLAVGMAIYLGQVLFLLVVLVVFHDQSWVDGPALGITALVVTLAWQVFAIRALRRTRQSVYDEPSEVVS